MASSGVLPEDMVRDMLGGTKELEPADAELVEE
jgi:hypothetical protein